MCYRNIIFFVILCFSFNLCVAQAQTADGNELSQLKDEFKTMLQKMEVMQAKIDRLESEQTKAKETVKYKEAKSQLTEGLKWHGYFSWNYEDETRRTLSPTFDAFALALIPSIALNEKIDLYSQLIFEHAPFYDITVSGANAARTLDARNSGEFTVNDAYLTYAVNDSLKLRAGKFATPFGVWNTLMYAAPTYPTIKQPGRDTLYSRGSSTDTDGNFYARYAMGAWILGNFHDVSYDFYVSNGRTSFAQHRDDNRDKGFGSKLGKDFSLGSAKLGLQYSYYQDKLHSAVGQAFFNQQTHAVSAEYTLGDLKLTSEYAASKRQGLGMDALYLLAEYHLNKFVPYAQYQAYEPNRHLGKDRTHYFTLGMGYHIISWRTMLKLQVDTVQGEPETAEDYQRFLLGLATAF